MDTGHPLVSMMDFQILTKGLTNASLRGKYAKNYS